MIRKVFIDLDDTLNSMTIPALRKVGCQIDGDLNYDIFPIPGSYDIVEAARKLLRVDVSAVEFWNALDQEFWANLPLSPEFYQILNFATRLVGWDNTCVLTSPTLDPQCSAGKVQWMQRRLPSRMRRQYLIGPRKRFCAGPDSLLIDDCNKNVDEFRSQGGSTILVPRPWNRLHDVNTSEFLTEIFECFELTQAGVIS